MTFFSWMYVVVCLKLILIVNKDKFETWNFEIDPRFRNWKCIDYPDRT